MRISDWSSDVCSSDLKIIGMLGGRAAEEVVYGSRTTGAENDIEQATGLARQMVTRWGMSDKIGMVQLAPRQNNWVGKGGGFMGDKHYSEETRSEEHTSEIQSLMRT